jgi:two-component system, cell cycle response regulator
MNEQLAERIRQCPNLPSLPSIAVQVLELVQRSDVDIAQIARTISKDSALASKILRTVNSSFYARGHAVSTISHALVILGLQSVKTLVLGFCLVSNLREKGFKHMDYWRRSIYAATASRTLASKVGVVQQEEAFLAALLADIGMLVLDQVLGEEYGRVHGAAGTHAALVAAERTAFGMDHAEASGVLAAHWKLPPVLAIPMGAHHSPEKVSDDTLKQIAQVVSVAGRCADVFVEAKPAEAIASVRKACLDLLNLPEAECDALMNEIGTRTKEVAPLFDISMASSLGYEEILKRANETLVELTLQTQQRASVIQQQASSLAEKNQELTRQASTDALTRLANRASFDAQLKEQFANVAKVGGVLSLLMVDIDRF